MPKYSDGKPVGGGASAPRIQDQRLVETYGEVPFMAKDAAPTTGTDVYCYDMAFDDDGNMYAIWEVDHEFSAAPGDTAFSAVVTCHDRSGNLKWSRRLGKVEAGQYWFPVRITFVDGVLLMWLNIDGDNHLVRLRPSDGYATNVLATVSSESPVAVTNGITFVSYPADSSFGFSPIGRDFTGSLMNAKFVYTSFTPDSNHGCHVDSSGRVYHVAKGSTGFLVTRIDMLGDDPTLAANAVAVFSVAASSFPSGVSISGRIILSGDRWYVAGATATQDYHVFCFDLTGALVWGRKVADTTDNVSGLSMYAADGGGVWVAMPGDGASNLDAVIFRLSPAGRRSPVTILGIYSDENCTSQYGSAGYDSLGFGKNSMGIAAWLNSPLNDALMRVPITHPNLDGQITRWTVGDGFWYQLRVNHSTAWAVVDSPMTPTAISGVGVSITGTFTTAPNISPVTMPYTPFQWDVSLSSDYPVLNLSYDRVRY